MTDVADDVRKVAAEAIQRERVARGGTARNDDETFRMLRSVVRGTLIHAHHELSGVPFEWLTNDDRVLDLVSTWLDQLRQRGGKT